MKIILLCENLNMVRHPRFELGPSAWKADILAIILMPLLEDFVYYTIFELILRVLSTMQVFHKTQRQK